MLIEFGCKGTTFFANGRLFFQSFLKNVAVYGFEVLFSVG